MTNKSELTNELISIVLPIFNEAEILKGLVKSIVNILKSIGCRYELLCVNDGSIDNTRTILEDLATKDSSVKVINLSRNYGTQAAIFSGLSFASGDAVIIMDSDMQDKPSDISHFIDKWHEGYDTVYAIRKKREESIWKKFLFLSFYRFFRAITDHSIPLDAGNFSLISRKVRNTLVEMNEYHYYFPGLRAWVGFKSCGIPLDRGVRYDKKPRVSLSGLWRLANDAIFSFSTLPLIIFKFLGTFALIAWFILSLWLFYHKFITGYAIPGWASTLFIVSLFGGLNMLGIGILGEYIFRIYDEARKRPKFIIESKLNISSRKGKNNKK